MIVKDRNKRQAHTCVRLRPDNASAEVIRVVEVPESSHFSPLDALDEDEAEQLATMGSACSTMSKLGGC